jgi:uncharacterized protein
MPFFNLFSRSPIQSLTEHMAAVVHAVQALAHLVSVLPNWTLAEAAHEQVIVAEASADVIKRDMRLHLSRGVWMPMSRQDVLHLISVQDDVANRAKDIAGVFIGRRMVLPDECHYQPLLNCAVSATQQGCIAVQFLQDAADSGFKGAPIVDLFNTIDTLHTLEHEADTLQRGLRQTIFALEKTMHPLDAWFAYDVVNQTGRLVDTMQHIGTVLGLLIKQTS